MKHIKTYESFETTVVLDLLSVCEYTGGLYDAIEKLKELASNSKSYNIKRDDKDFKTYFDHYTISGRDSITGNPEDAIDLNGETFSYAYLLKNPNKNIYFTFYNVNVKDEILLTLSSINKFNL